jgi:hypothetical protein
MFRQVIEGKGSIGSLKQEVLDRISACSCRRSYLLARSSHPLMTAAASSIEMTSNLSRASEFGYEFGGTADFRLHLFHRDVCP